MRKVQFILMAPATLCAVFLVSWSAQSETIQEKPDSVSFFDVLDLPARIDEPKLVKSKDKYLLNCALANRSGEPIFGLRLIFMTVDSEGKLRTRVTWSEESEVAAYSIKTFQFSLHLKDRAQKGDRYFLAIDEVLGSETLWRAVDSEKALRAYSRGQHDVVPKVRAVSNKDDRERGPVVIPLKLRKP
jgi:hypothetical protein